MKKNIDNKFICFSGDVSIYLKNGLKKNIDDVSVGDQITNYNIYNKRFDVTIVEKVVSSEHTIRNTITFSNNSEIKSTIDHPYFIVGKGWCSVNPELAAQKYKLKVNKMVVGDICLYFNGKGLSNVQIIEISTQFGEYKMYNISGGENHNFFANGILVHDENIMEFDLTQKGVEFELLEL